MSVSLVINRPGCDTEFLHLGSHRMLKDGWATMAAELGLELIPHFYSFLPVEPGNLDQLLAELATFRAAMVRLGPSYGENVEIIDRLVARLEGLKQSEGWSASIG